MEVLLQPENPRILLLRPRASPKGNFQYPRYNLSVISEMAVFLRLSAKNRGVACK